MEPVFKAEAFFLMETLFLTRGPLETFLIYDFGMICKKRHGESAIYRNPDLIFFVPLRMLQEVLTMLTNEYLTLQGCPYFLSDRMNE